MITFVLLTFALTMLTDALLIITPYLMPETECFAVTVPHGAREKEPLKDYMRSYVRWMLLITALDALIWLVACVFLRIDLATKQGEGAFTLLITTTICIPILVSFVLMLHYRKQVMAVKQERGWYPEHARSAALIGSEDFPAPISLAWYLIYLPLLAAEAIFALTNYDRFPNMIPMSIDLNGVVSDTVPKSLGSVLFPVYLTAFFGLVFAVMHWGTIHSKRPIDPSAPASSALAYGEFSRAMSIVMLAGGWLLSALTGAAFFASTLGIISLSTAATMILLVSLAFVLALTFISLVLGQSGGRIAAQGHEGSMTRDDDAFWYLGTFYCNRDDPSIFVPKRFGVGWTLNVARWETWGFIVGLTLLCIAFSLLLSQTLS